MLIYTYPHALSYRRSHNGISWIRAFWEVIKAGGDSDRRQPKRRRVPKTRRGKFTKDRRDSLRNEPAVMDVGESFVGDVERIRSSYYSSDVRSNYHSRDDNTMFGSTNNDTKNIEEKEQDVDLRNVPTDFNVNDNSVDDIEQMK